MDIDDTDTPEQLAEWTRAIEAALKDTSAAINRLMSELWNCGCNEGAKELHLSYNHITNAIKAYTGNNNADGANND